ncbi:type II toxin-antitoxin system VapC family toxin [Chloroflexales bacterium ZM16-3]|nr:type II toxin-antitoxin system VapC family toxin [Chloroflexales bacterium ZM16-3]
MADYYADSSVLVKRHIQEVGTAQFCMLADPEQGHTIITVHLSRVEVVSAFRRRVREGMLPVADAVQLQADFDGLCQTEYRLVGLLEPIIAKACYLLVQYPLRAYDAIQLAAALYANAALVAGDLPPLTFLSADAYRSLKFLGAK